MATMKGCNVMKWQVRHRNPVAALVDWFQGVSLINPENKSFYLKSNSLFQEHLNTNTLTNLCWFLKPMQRYEHLNY